MEQEEQEVVNHIYNYTADLILQGTHKVIVIADLKEKGLSDADANLVYDNTMQMIRHEKRKHAKKGLLYGALWLIGGLVVTIVSYQLASNGGTYVVTWGAMIYGLIKIVKSLTDF